ncbi:MAG: nitrate/nitrite transporter NrtS, partial [Burkholderiales bacterium]
MGPRLKAIRDIAFSAKVLKRTLSIALVVGSLLNVINPCAALFGTASMDGLRLALNYAVPYLVSTCTAV